MPQFLVSPDALTATQVVVSGPELHHLRVRRLRVGSELILFDGSGHRRRGVVAAMRKNQAIIQLTSEELGADDSSLHLTLAQALIKGAKLDLVIEKATELGVTELIIFVAERSLSRVGSARPQRWQRIARSAAKQSQRAWVPEIVGPISYADLLARPDDGLRLLFSERAAPGALDSVHRSSPECKSVVAVVGPEGGFTVPEVDQAIRAGFRPVGLAPRILRSETASLVAVTLCQFLWGDFGQHSP